MSEPGSAGYDYVVVGGGSAGCAVAARLADDPSVSVLLLEAGPRNRRVDARVPLAYPLMFKSAFDWDFSTEPEPALEDRRVYWPRGRMLGGSSAMNAMIYMRGAPSDYDEWAAAGLVGWSYDEVLERFRRAEDNSRGPSAQHGVGGPLSVSDQRERGALSNAFVAAAQQAGLAYNDDFNSGRQDGVGWFQVTQRRGRRVSSAHAYLARRRPNLTVLTDAQAVQVVVRDGRAAGVRYRGRDGLAVVPARREVVLSAGAVNTPHLLLVSGIGPAAQLREVGVDVVADVPGVGENLQDHLAVGLVWSVSTPTLLGRSTAADLFRFMLRGRGPLVSNIVEAGAFLRSAPDVPAPDLQLHFAPMFITADGLDRPTRHGVVLWVTLLRPDSRGSLRLRSADPLVPPVIQAGYLSQPSDRDVLLTGVRKALEIAAMPALDTHIVARLLPAQTSPGALEAFVRQESRSMFHPVGTCAMGTVVDEKLRVRGVTGLRVADASVMPTIVRGNTNAPAMMIGEKAADLISAARGPRISARR